MKIAVLGGTKYIKEFEKLFVNTAEIVFFIDNSPQLQNETIGGKKVFSPYDFPQNLVDYIVIFIYEYRVLSQELSDLGVDVNRIINFNDANLDLRKHKNIFNLDVADRIRLKMKTDYLDRRIGNMENNQLYFEQNYMYEVADMFRKGKILLPHISSVAQTCDKIITDRCSISRYGDGEFEIILGHAKDIYQGNNKELADRLKNILLSELQNHIVALADDYGAMEGIRKENRDVIRKYMTPEKREQHYSLLDMNREYFNAYISRPYVIYPHDEIEQAKKRFERLKRIWDKQDVLFVEGNKTRMGVGNDLFHNAASIQRIIAPNENAYDVYNDIYHAVLEHGKGKLILIALGPTATVLAYDMARKGYWALDIGHLDLEYEWVLQGKGDSYIPHKYNNDMLGDTKMTDISDEEYMSSIIGRIAV